MDAAPAELSLVRRRHSTLSNLANSLDNNSDLNKSQHDLQAINSYIKDISLYLSNIYEQVEIENYNAIKNVETSRRVNAILLVLGIICMFVVFIVQIIVIIVPVIRSVSQLQIGLAKIGRGDLDYYVDIKTNDEIEQLANGFNEMTKKLQNVYYSLESKVTERTSALHKLNQDLQAEIVERIQTENELQDSKVQLIQKAQQLEVTLRELQETQAQLIQNEKMSSLGQLVAGVAHEINNPVNFIHGNIIPLKEYIHNFIGLINLYQTYYFQPNEEIEEYIEDIDLPFILEDANKILASLEIGTTRIKEIVLSLRNFSRLDEAEMKEVDIHEGIENTLLILQHRIKGKPHEKEIEIIKDYSDLPLIECYPGQLNQVFMNIISNAIDSLEESKKRNQYNQNHLLESEQQQIIRIQTKQIKDNCIAIHIADNGMGIDTDDMYHIFDPFFTTKPVGKGTGLGLSLSYQVVHAKHQGNLRCITQPGKGAEFIIELPIKQDFTQR
jgi:signal transduction histidine kinase